MVNVEGLKKRGEYGEEILGDEERERRYMGSRWRRGQVRGERGNFWRCGRSWRW